ncbi:MAG TPA: GspH/FimT family pseudopilin [Burkholderiales bacterium]|nr:GspH/FimT family pseudopilin [Burkholderiales bacterium]
MTAARRERGLPAHRPARGFTIIEALVTLAVLAILTTIAVPNITAWIVSARVRAAASDVYSALIFARSEAVKRSSNVDIVPAGTWSGGWNVQVGAVVLQTQAAYPSSLTFTGPPGTVTYGRDGRLTGVSNVTFTVSGITQSGAVRSRTVSVDLSGRPSVK